MNGNQLNTRDKFLSTWPKIKADIIQSASIDKFPQEALKWFEESLDYNVPGGKLNRGTSVIDTLEILKGSPLTSDQYHRAAVLGWCVELLQALFLVSDDMMDQSVTRRGQPCWYRVPQVGNIAINDSFMLGSSIYVLIKKYFRQDPNYVNILELFHDTTYQTELGQLIDLLTSQEDVIDLNKFSLPKHQLIVIYKTAFYSFYLPVALGMRLHGITSPSDPSSSSPSGSTDQPDLYKQAMEILIPLGEYFQVQDDFLDCFGEPELIDKSWRNITEERIQRVNLKSKKSLGLKTLIYLNDLKSMKRTVIRN